MRESARRAKIDAPMSVSRSTYRHRLSSENGWRITGSPYDCDVMLERSVTREVAEQELRRAEVWDRLVLVASPDDDGHVVWRDHPGGRPAPRRPRRSRR